MLCAKAANELELIADYLRRPLVCLKTEQQFEGVIQEVSQHLQATL